MADKAIDHTGPCWWLVEVASGNPEPDSESDRWRTVECTAPARYYRDGSFDCDAGHAMGSMYEELGPYGNEWQREQEDRAHF